MSRLTRGNRPGLRLTAMLWAVAPLVGLAGCSELDGPAGAESGSPPQRAQSRASTVPKTDSIAGAMYDTPFIVEGIKQPPMTEAAAAELQDDARVIGITVNGTPRAYSIRALSGMQSHVVNDLIDDVPVSVTYCNRTDCTRVLTSETDGTPIDLWIGGFTRGEMALRFNEQQFAHMSKDLPLSDYPYTVTTWKEWLEQHPQTDVFIGAPAAE